MDSDESNGLDLDANGARKVSVLLADDDQTILQIIVASLETQHREQLDIVGTARSSEEHIMRAQVIVPEVVFIDLTCRSQEGCGQFLSLQELAVGRSSRLPLLCGHANERPARPLCRVQRQSQDCIYDRKNRVQVILTKGEGWYSAFVFGMNQFTGDNSIPVKRDAGMPTKRH